MGENNLFGEGSINGGTPQHVTAAPPFGQVRIGDGNTFREHTTVHSSLKESSVTVIGNENYMMVGVHVGHDCVIGNSNILVNGVMLGGHVVVANRAMIGGQARVVQDVPPFVTVDGLTGRIVGLNLIGLRRSGRTSEDMRLLKCAYFTLYRSGKTWKEILQIFQENYSTGPVAEMTQFLLATKRGIVRERANAPAQLRVIESDEPSNVEPAVPVAMRAIG